MYDCSSAFQSVAFASGFALDLPAAATLALPFAKGGPTSTPRSQVLLAISADWRGVNLQVGQAVSVRGFAVTLAHVLKQ